MIEVQGDPRELGFDPARLRRLDRHFERYTNDGRLPGWLLVVTRDGRIAHVSQAGMRDREAGLPVERDTLWRIHSMTKPVTSVAAMVLWEMGAFELSDPVGRYLPEFAAPRVYAQGPPARPVTVAATEPLRIWHLLTHTAGLTYGFHHAHPVDELYRSRGFDWSLPPGLDLAACCQVWAELPLLFQPGSAWNYSVATDVLGRLIEVVSGCALDEALAALVLQPLGMHDTAFHVTAPDAGRLAALYRAVAPGGPCVREDELGSMVLNPPEFLSGGGGLVSTAADYHRFTQMILRGGELGGVRVLSRRTVSLMTRNHLPRGADLEAVGRPLFAETPMSGVGFGLGFSVVLDPLATHGAASPGELAWGGAAGTAFFVDPAERVTALFFTQVMPSDAHPLRTQLRQLVYQALTD